jgi:hypothetical protein
MGKIYVGQIGVLIELDTQDNLTGATKAEIRYYKPDKSTGAWTGTIVGTKITRLISLNTDLDIAGNWLLQAYAEGSGWALLGETVNMTVYNLWK